MKEEDFPGLFLAADKVAKNYQDKFKLVLKTNLITLVIRQGREKHLQGIAQQYINKVEDMKGVQRITLTSAVALLINDFLIFSEAPSSFSKTRLALAIPV